jgi:4-hydroxy-4-methyl-2-oxoglutarate aldolase
MPTRVYQPAATPLAPALIAGWAGVPTTIAADLFRGRTLVDPALRPLRPFGGGRRLAGSAVTVFCERADYGPVHHAIAAAAAGDVILVDAGGRVDIAMIGELLSEAARRKGVAGVAVDGAVRDIGTLSGWSDFPVFCRGHTARGPASMERGTVNDTIMLGGVRVAPRDLVIGDDDGLVVIPQGEAEARLADALAMVNAEADWEVQLAGGRSTVEVFGVPAAQVES